MVNILGIGSCYACRPLSTLIPLITREIYRSGKIVRRGAFRGLRLAMSRVELEYVCCSLGEGPSMGVIESKPVHHRGVKCTHFRGQGMYLKGEGTTGNHTRAVELYELAAEENHVRAFNGLGYEYFNGNALPRNLVSLTINMSNCILV